MDFHFSFCNSKCTILHFKISCCLSSARSLIKKFINKHWEEDPEVYVKNLMNYNEVSSNLEGIL